jgi:hypothetical protein
MFMTALVGLSALVALAGTDEEAVGAVQHRSGIRGEVGLAAANGLLGATAWRDLLPAVRIEGGAGVGLSGLQVSAAAALVLGSEHDRFITGAGVSLGIPVSSESVFRDRHGGSPVVMPWLDVDLVGYEHRTLAGWTLLVAAGTTTPLRRAHWDLTGDFGANVVPFRSWFPQGRFAIGKSF